MNSSSGVSDSLLTPHYKAQVILATDLIILNHGQMTMLALTGNCSPNYNYTTDVKCISSSALLQLALEISGAGLELLTSRPRARDHLTTRLLRALSL
ncbi:hypothetical protein TNCV_4063091 [Trichonephila clavipes]|nr:hypothetical protein TNCV_4063091 [Trichonephila clavipes]